jgi:hypothetical protein
MTNELEEVDASNHCLPYSNVRKLLHRGAEEVHKNLSQHKPGIEPRFKPGTFRILLRFLHYFFLTFAGLLIRCQL